MQCALQQLKTWQSPLAEMVSHHESNQWPHTCIKLSGKAKTLTPQTVHHGPDP